MPKFTVTVVRHSSSEREFVVEAANEAAAEEAALKAAYNHVFTEKGSHYEVDLVEPLEGEE